MTFVLRALAGIALVAPAAASARPPEPPRVEAPAEAETGTIISEAATRVADWIAASGDNHALPYAIVDKQNATLLLFDAKGKPLDQVPVLIGIAAGDEATAGVGSKKLAEIGPAEKTTPAGRFLAKFGIPFRKERILWVDYATSVAMHTIPADAAKKDRRRERMLSATPDDNRITFGCINVPKAFYGKFLRPQFSRKGGYVYVLPDTKPLEEVFPRLRVHALTQGASAS
ncbi:hypothetical protein LK533_13135 [Sphingomonas sp. PL-96]|uniref:hypothetical protein n=1 Tax=Sphingomonas sp. PL-96 TaxID=2887201 RepID=UPI001E2FADDF|nr:hypothetical protein [Sphingomonas sp. PL-96]MCC2977616.1 hypothetical protein [Sphingomonas sp. PL-96]